MRRVPTRVIRYASGHPEQTVIEAQLIAEGAQTTLIWEERGMPVNLLPAYARGDPNSRRASGRLHQRPRTRRRRNVQDELVSAYDY
jgi:hypothetical protein